MWCKNKHTCMKDNILVSKSIVWNAVNEISFFPWGGLNLGVGVLHTKVCTEISLIYPPHQMVKSSTEKRSSKG